MPQKPGHLSWSPKGHIRVEGENTTPYITHVPTPLLLCPPPSPCPTLCGVGMCVYKLMWLNACLRVGACTYIHRDQSLMSAELLFCSYSYSHRIWRPLLSLPGCLCLPSAETAEVQWRPVFTWALGIQTWVLMLSQQILCRRNHLPKPAVTF